MIVENRPARRTDRISPGSTQAILSLAVERQLLTIFAAIQSFVSWIIDDCNAMYEEQ